MSVEGWFSQVLGYLIKSYDALQGYQCIGHVIPANIQLIVQLSPKYVIFCNFLLIIFTCNFPPFYFQFLDELYALFMKNRSPALKTFCYKKCCDKSCNINTTTQINVKKCTLIRTPLQTQTIICLYQDSVMISFEQPQKKCLNRK